MRIRVHLPLCYSASSAVVSPFKKFTPQRARRTQRGDMQIRGHLPLCYSASCAVSFPPQEIHTTEDTEDTEGRHVDSVAIFLCVLCLVSRLLSVLKKRYRLL